MQKLTTKQIFIAALAAPVALGLVIGSIVLTATNVSFGGEELRHITGKKNAKVTVVEYSDFQCPFCERAYPTMKQLVQEYGDRISVEFRHFPLSFHPFAAKAAEASECAAEQGKFWQFHDYAFEHQTALSFDALKQWAGAIGLNTSKFNTCLDSGKYAAKVAAQQAEGEQLGVNGTPTAFINGKSVVGAQPYEVFKQAVEDALKQ